jgi:hypothetical protein
MLLPLVCGLGGCTIKQKTFAMVDAHWLDKHGKEAYANPTIPYNDDMCGIAFSNARSLYNHIFGHNTDCSHIGRWTATYDASRFIAYRDEYMDNDILRTVIKRPPPQRGYQYSGLENQFLNTDDLVQLWKDGHSVSMTVQYPEIAQGTIPGSIGRAGVVM